MRAIRITTSNWLNDQVGGDQNAIKVINDDMAREAVEVWGIAVYAPEHDPAGFVGPDRAAERLAELKATVEEWQPTPPPEEPFEPVLDQDALEAGFPVDIEASDMTDTPVELPRSVDNKAAWVRWAVHGDHGQPAVTEEQASAMPKLQLQHRYGGRL